MQITGNHGNGSAEKHPISEIFSYVREDFSGKDVAMFGKQNKTGLITLSLHKSSSVVLSSVGDNYSFLPGCWLWRAGEDRSLTLCTFVATRLHPLLGVLSFLKTILHVFVPVTSLFLHLSSVTRRKLLCVHLWFKSR